jgi:uncharacterized membrane protein YphA (DoxX/SURF4 family)
MEDMLLLLDRFFLWVRLNRWCYRFTLFTRILLAAGFIPTGMVKLLGRRFAGISMDEPIGFFFEAFHQSGGYWRFIGASQVLAGLLLLWPRTAHLGAALFAPIMVNIFAITLSMQFGGTPLVTGPMLLAVIYLCMWDFHRFRPMITQAAHTPSPPVQRLDAWERIGFTVFGISIIGFFGSTRGFVATQFASILIAAGLLSGLCTLLRFGWTSMPRGTLKS